jgi:hypothetical protein
MIKIPNKLDFIRTHTSNVGDLLVTSMLLVIALYVPFLFYDLYSHKTIFPIFYKKFEYEAEYYSYNSSSKFHFIQIFSPKSVDVLINMNQNLSWRIRHIFILIFLLPI